MIFYFSGTGNSEWAARTLAELLDDKVISIAEVMLNGQLRFPLAEGEKIGWVFPIHSWGPPPIVLDFISKMHINDYNPQCFCYMVCTCGDDIGMSVDMLQDALGRIRCHSAYSIQMPNTYICMKGFDVDSPEVEKQKLEKAETRIREIAERISRKKIETDVVTGSFKWIKSKVINPYFHKFEMSDKPFVCNTDLCTSCGTCVSSCPVNNITLSEGHPVWNHNCTLCLSCLHRCPTRAINYGKKTVKKGRYFHK